MLRILLLIVIAIILFACSTELFVFIVAVLILLYIGYVIINYLTGDDDEESAENYDNITIPKTRFNGPLLQKQTPTSFKHQYGVDHVIYDTFKNYREPEERVIDFQLEEIDADSNSVRFIRARDNHLRITKENNAARTADYYKHHFSDEFRANENKEWWSKYEPY